MRGRRVRFADRLPPLINGRPVIKIVRGPTSSASLTAATATQPVRCHSRTLMDQELYNGWRILFRQNVHMYCHQLTASKGDLELEIPCEDMPAGPIGIWPYTLELDAPVYYDLLMAHPCVGHQHRCELSPLRYQRPIRAQLISHNAVRAPLLAPSTSNRRIDVTPNKACPQSPASMPERLRW